MKTLPHITSLFVVSLLFCRMGCSGCFAAPAAEPQLKTFHNVSVLPHTGQMQYNVELYRIKDADFDWPVSITYSSDGFRPFDYSDPVGSGWTLNAGGVITRQIMGDADDSYNQYADRGTTIGFYALLQDTNIYTPPSANVMWNELKHSRQYKYPLFDCKSDIYTFSFAGYSGRFIIDWDGKAVLLSGDFVEVDLSGMTIQKDLIYDCNAEDYHYTPHASTIRLTTIDGWCYTFGGTAETLEYSWIRQQDNTTEALEINAWYLTQVKLPNGHCMNYHYTPLASEEASSLYKKSVAYQTREWRAGNFYMPPFYTDTLNFHTHLLDDTSPYMIYNPFAVWTKTVRLDSLTSSNGLKVAFVYNNIPHDMNANLHYGNGTKPFLSSVITMVDDTELSHWTFDYTTVSWSQKTKMYLTTLKGNESITYKFKYNIGNSAAITDLTDIYRTDIYGYRTSHPFFGLLREAVEPTGSITTFDYTYCDYDSIRILMHTEDGMSSVIRPADGKRIVHNAAISTIELRDTKGIMLKKHYDYGESESDFNHGHITIQEAPMHASIPDIPLTSINSYGILNIDYAFIRLAEAGEPVYMIPIECYPLMPASPPVEYTKAIETISYDGTTIAKKNIYYYDTTTDLYEYSKTPFEGNILDVYPYLSQWNRRSKPICIEEYDINQQLRQRSSYKYPQYAITYSQRDSSLLEKQHPSSDYTAMAIDNFACVVIPIVPDKLSATEKSAFESNGTWQQKVSYQRDSLYRIVREDIEDGNTRRFIRYTYPDNLFQESKSIVDAHLLGYVGLKKQCRIGSPVETVSGFVRNGKEYITHGEITLYKKYGVGSIAVQPDNPFDVSDSLKVIPKSAPNQNFLPWYAPAATLSLQTAEPLTDYVPLSVQNGKPCADSRYDTTAVYSYNSHLRMTEVVPQNGIPVRYQWDKQGLYCIAETSGGQQHSYTYYPYIGIATETDARGITTYYAYDSLGRLTEVWRMVDGKKQIINAWNYHYATEE